MRHSTWVIAVFILGGYCWFVSNAHAQTPTTGQIVGTVKDPSGAVINDAKVTLTSPAGVQRETASGATGRYAFSLVPPGTYRVDSEKAGFSKATAENVVVRITETTNLDIRLRGRRSRKAWSKLWRNHRWCNRKTLLAAL